MLRLDPVFRDQLLERHQSPASPGSEKAEKLTPEDLDRYDTLVGQRSILERARVGTFMQPQHETTPDTEIINDALKQVNERIDFIRSTKMQFFNEVHRDWLDNRRSRELGNANRAFKKRWQPTQDRKGGFSGFAAGIVLIFILGFTTIGFFSSEKFGRDQRRGTVVGKLVPPPSSKPEIRLSDSEKEVLWEWHKGAQTGQRSYLAAIVHTDRALLEKAGYKLFRQGKAWLALRSDTSKINILADVDSNEGKGINRLQWACEIGAILEEECRDKALLDSVAVLLTSRQYALLPLLLTTK